MRDATTVLAIIQARGSRGLPLENVYRQLYNPALYRLAYGRIARNAGAMTPGVTSETVDGMSQAKIDALIDAVRHERYRWTPVRRTYIEKKGSVKQRPLGIPTWSDKLLQEVIRLLLEAYYEPQFQPTSHGFRPGRGCHTALSTVRHWTGTHWFIEGDIAAYFDRIDHTVLLSILGEQIHDRRFLQLIARLLQAGYLEDWRYHPTLSGVPQGGVVSPILANLYLNRLDGWVATTLVPAYTRGLRRRRNPTYVQLGNAQRPSTGKSAVQIRALRKQMHATPSADPQDPDFRRLRYIRYADDFLLGFSGPRAEAEEIKRQLEEYLRDTLHLELSPTKTLITHAATQAARFLGYDIDVHYVDSWRSQAGRRGRRAINGQIGLKVPRDVIQDKCQTYLRRGEPAHLTIRTHDSDFSIVATYQQEYRGIVEYYRLAQNLRQLGRLRWVMQTSLARTLAHKHQMSVAKVYQRYHATFPTPKGPRRGLEVRVDRPARPPLVARWGGVSLVRRTDAVLNDHPPQIWSDRTELVQRLLADTCELCGASAHIEVHHIRKLQDLQRPGRRQPPPWVARMIARQRKTLVVCHACHVAIHAGRPTGRGLDDDSGEPDDAKVSRPVRRGAVGKVPAA